MRSFSSLLLLGAASATDCQVGDFCITSCNDVNNNNAAAMTLSIDKDYMESHHPLLLSTFTLDGNDYTTTIQGASLTLNMTDSDYIFLDYELETAQVAIPGLSDIYFAGRTTGFRCRYPRAVSVSGSYVVPPHVDPSPYVNNGILQYDFTTAVDNGRTEIVITPQHGVPGLEANIHNCAISYAPMPDDIIYAVRFQESWGDTDVCIDNRIETTFNYANGGATIDWRTFHYNDPTAASFSQQQDVTCEIEVSDTLSVSAPSNCDCHNEEDCRTISHLPGDHTISAGNLLDSGLTIPSLWKLTFDMFLDNPNGIQDGNALLVTQRDPAEADYGWPITNCGDRYPGIWVQPGQQNRYVMRHCIGTDANFNLNYAPWNMNNWQSFEIGQRDESGVVYFYVIIDGHEHYRIEQTLPQSHTNMRIYAADPWHYQQGLANREQTLVGTISNIRLTDETIF